MNELVTLVSTVGFPIAMCFCLCWYIYKIQEKTNKAIENFTVTVERLNARIDKLFEKGGGENGSD